MGWCYVPRRYVFLLLGFLAMCNVFIMRVSLSMAMTAMVNSSIIFSLNDTQVSSECPDIHQGDELKIRNTKEGVYNWDTNTQGLILGAIYYGVMFMELPGAVLSEKFGAKWVIGVSIFVSAILNLLIPLAADWGPSALVILRILQGLFQGSVYPPLNSMVAKWCHKLERSRFLSIIKSGILIGIVTSMAMTGWLIDIDILGGWPLTFYIFGICGCIWFILWTTLVYETPAEHSNISKEELNYLERDKEIAKEKGPIPWKAIFTSVPVWATVITTAFNEFAFILFITEMPTYLYAVLHFKMVHDGLLSALGFILQAVFGYSSSYIADIMRKSERYSITNIRKAFTSIGIFGSAACLLGVTFSGCHFQIIIGLVTLSRAFAGIIGSGLGTTHIDLSPAFAGTINAIIYTICGLCGIVGPSIVGVIINNTNTMANWNCVFYFAATCQTLGGLIFLLFGSAELQPWGKGDVDTNTNKNYENRHYSKDGVISNIENVTSSTKCCVTRVSTNLRSRLSSLLPSRKRKKFILRT